MSGAMIPEGRGDVSHERENLSPVFAWQELIREIYERYGVTRILPRWISPLVYPEPEEERVQVDPVERILIERERTREILRPVITHVNQWFSVVTGREPPSAFSPSSPTLEYGEGGETPEEGARPAEELLERRIVEQLLRMGEENRRRPRAGSAPGTEPVVPEGERRIRDLLLRNEFSVERESPLVPPRLEGREEPGEISGESESAKRELHSLVENLERRYHTERESRTRFVPFTQTFPPPLTHRESLVEGREELLRRSGADLTPGERRGSEEPGRRGEEARDWRVRPLLHSPWDPHNREETPPGGIGEKEARRSASRGRESVAPDVADEVIAAKTGLTPDQRKEVESLLRDEIRRVRVPDVDEVMAGVEKRMYRDLERRGLL